MSSAGRKEWVVREDGPRDVAGVLRALGAPIEALHDGRVFVGPRRAGAPSDAVQPGDVVTVAAAAAVLADVEILARDGDVVAALKPAGIPTIADHGGAAHALVARVAVALGVDEARVHPTSRLDREVSGVVVFALSKVARERLARAREEHTYARRYVALAVPGSACALTTATWDAPIGRARDPRHRAVNGRDATHARTHVAAVARAPGTACLLLALAPVTGRTHQLRVHAAHAGAPLLGDRTYGGAAATRLVLPNGKVVALARIALHAARVSVPRAHGGAWTIEAPIPTELGDTWRLLGGEASAWDTAVSCPLPLL